jgi:hypothetical protein
MDTKETLRPFPLGLVHADSSLKWTKERWKGERVEIHCLTKEMLPVYAKEHSHKIADMTQDF